MPTKNDKTKTRRTGPRPKMITLYPFTFDEVVDTLLTKKSQKVHEKLQDESTEKDKEVNEEKKG